MTSGNSSLAQQLLFVLTMACRQPRAVCAAHHCTRHRCSSCTQRKARHPSEPLDRSCAQPKAGQQLPTQRLLDSPAQHMRLSTPGQMSTLCSLGCRCSLLGTFHRKPAKQQQNNMKQVNSSTCPLGAAASAHLNAAQHC